jgi:hypothetical protein
MRWETVTAKAMNMLHRLLEEAELLIFAMIVRSLSILLASEIVEKVAIRDIARTPAAPFVAEKLPPRPNNSLCLS